jgi:hypothetical protein
MDVFLLVTTRLVSLYRSGAAAVPSDFGTFIGEFREGTCVKWLDKVGNVKSFKWHMDTRMGFTLQRSSLSASVTARLLVKHGDGPGWAGLPELAFQTGLGQKHSAHGSNIGPQFSGRMALTVSDRFPGRFIRLRARGHANPVLFCRARVLGSIVAPHIFGGP